MALLERMTKEACLTTDEFNRPKILEGREAISTLLVQLILLEPGTYSNRPGKGVGLVSRYRYNDEPSINKLQEDIKEQISIYLPDFQAVDVNVYMDKKDNNEIVIDIHVDGVLYKYETIEQKNNKIGLIDLKI